VGNAVIVPQGLNVATWATRELPTNSIYYGDEATGRELAVDGAHGTYFGSGSNVPALLHGTTFPRWQRVELIKRGVDFVVGDRRKISSNNEAAYFFQPASDPTLGFGYFPAGGRAKFAIPNVSSIFDSGDIVVYDVRGLHERPTATASSGSSLSRAGRRTSTARSHSRLARRSRGASS
jgi:hypothetical protein